MESYRELFPEFRDRFEASSHFLHLAIPSVVRPGEPFELRAVMMDAAGMPEEDFRGRVPLQPSDPELKTPDYIEFGPEDRGRVTVDGLRVEKPGAYYVTAEPPDCPGSPPTSNAARAKQDGPRLFWGDIHFHTVVGNCHPDRCKSPEFGYWYAREVALLDFGSATDHLRGIHRIEGNWPELREAARNWNRPGEFVSFLAFESSHATGYGGDNNIYYNADEADYFWLDRDDMKGAQPKVGLRELWDWLDERGVPYISIPHHTARAAKYRDFENEWHNPERERVLEVFSWWGSSEGRHDGLYLKGGRSEKRSYWRDALELGYRYGAIGSSDTHNTMPGTPATVIPANYHSPQVRLNCQGLAAIYADQLRRDDLFEGLMRRRCYGTTWWRPAIEFSVSGVDMGEEAEAGPTLKRRRHLELSVAAAGRGGVSLYRNNRQIASEGMQPGLTKMEFTDDEPLEKVAVRGAPNSDRPFAFYYARLHANGQVAWSSPVWLTL